MNRPLKFRAWDTGKKEMFVPYELSFTKRGITVRGGKEASTRKTYSLHDRTVLMQFAGLHDKNGKEIYEGDIVKYSVFERFHEEESENIGKVEYVVHKNGRVGFAPMIWNTHVEDEFYNYEIENIEVIGNVWENPELLTS